MFYEMTEAEKQRQARSKARHDRHYYVRGEVLRKRQETLRNRLTVTAAEAYIDSAVKSTDAGDWREALVVIKACLRSLAKGR
jgi:hypothetical protein